MGHRGPREWAERVSGLASDLRRAGSRRWAPLTILALALLAGGCNSNRRAQDPNPEAAGVSAESRSGVATDTLRGTIAVVGSEPLTDLVIRPVGDDRQILLEGNELQELRRVDGLEVWVVGKTIKREGVPPLLGGLAFQVDRFEVRAANGVPAVDGVLSIRGDVVTIRLYDGTELPVRHLPRALIGEDGARVWLSGSLDGDIDSFGLIRPGRTKK